MEAANPDLEAALRSLQAEFEEGEITAKGFEKRRTRLLSQFVPQQGPAAQRGGLRIHSPDDSDHPASNDGSRAASLAALTGVVSGSTLTAAEPPNVTKQVAVIKDGFGPGDGSFRSHSPQNLAQRFQEREFGSSVHGRGASGQGQEQKRDTLTIDSSSPESSRLHTLVNYAFNPDSQQEYVGGNGEETRESTMLSSQQGYFSDFAGQQRLEPQEITYGGHAPRYSQGDLTSPTVQIPPPFLNPGELAGGAAVHQMPLEPRGIPFAVCDPHNPNTEMSQFENMAEVLRYRAKTNAKQAAYWALDQKGKELVSITWEKLASRAEKVAQIIRDKSSLYIGDRVALLYTENEIIEFAVALMGCFLAGVVAVPITDLKNYQRLNVVLTSTQAHLVLTTEANLKNFQREITAAKLSWPRGVEWWKTNEFGSYHPKKGKEEPPVRMPDLAYIEFSTAPTGDLRGVVLSHRTIMDQMKTLSSILCTATSNTRGDTFNPNLRDKQGHVITGTRHGETILSYLDPRSSIGMILGVLLNVFGGHTVVWMDHRTIETPGLYAHLITKHKATLIVADYPGLKRAAYNYQADPMTTRNFKKGLEPNFSSVKLCMIDTLTVDAEFHELLADRWLKPLRNTRAREIVAPLLCLPEHGGMAISMRDWLGGEERMGCSLTHEMDHDHADEEKKEDENTINKTGFGSSLIGGGTTVRKSSKERSTEDLGEVLLDKEALKTNDIVVLALGSEARAKASSFPNAVRCGGFGYPLPDATVAVVDPESGLLCSPNSIGEIWVDSPSLSGGFWNLPKHTETIFHARPYAFKEGNPTPAAIEPEFLRTGLLGCVIEGKIFILGLYEDRLRQRVEWVEHGMAVQEHRYFFVQHLILSIMRNVPKIHDCSAFDVFVNDEHLPIVLLESASASTEPLTSGGPPRQLDIALLDSLSERTMEVLFEEHHLRVYCVLITAPGVLPRVNKNGRREIGNMLCRRDFDNGSLPCVHVKFGVERAVQNLPIGEDITGGIWSQLSSNARQNILYDQETQYSGVDHREVVIDDRTSTSLSNFSNIFDLMQWRVVRQADELAYCTVDARGKEGKGLTWKKFDARVAAVAMFLKNKIKLTAGDHVILMYTHSEDYVFAIYACFVLGVIAIPCAPLDQNRLSEDAPAYLHIVADMRVRAVLCNTEVDHLFRQKIVSQHLKQSAQFLKTYIPPAYNTAKPPKQSHGCRDLSLTMNKAWILPNNPVVIWTYWTPDQRRISVELGHDTILGMCKVQKETCQMTSSKPVLGCVRSTMGLGFIHTALMGVYNGSPTYLISPLDFAQSPQSLFLALSRYKVKDTYATSQMLDFAVGNNAGKGLLLHELKNLMISTDSRPRQDIFAKMRSHFASSGLERTAINTIYSHVLNPMIASRSYMSIEPIELWLDIRALRRGLVYPVDPDNEPACLCVQDSGMVPVSTQIAIVNPETCQLCHIGEYGEIWVRSEASAKSFYMSRQAFDSERFNGRIHGGDPNSTYVRTGDLGFLHNVTRPIGANNQPVEMQILFVLGSIGETFEVNGLNHFPVDIERSVEQSHRNITPGGSAVFQAGGLVVVLVEVFRKAYLASIVPVIVNAILNEHQIVVDIVAFVGEGDFPRSRLSEKQRGKILASWVTRKLRTIAQFCIRDPDATDGHISEVPEPRSGQASSITSKGMHTRGQSRGSMGSEIPANVSHGRQERIVSTGSSIMPELPLSLPSPQYFNDQQGIYEAQPTESREGGHGVALNDAPYTLPEGASEMPTNSYGDESDRPETPYDSGDEKFFDPNADPEHPFGDEIGDETPNASALDLPSSSQSARLALIEPSVDSANANPASSRSPTTFNPNLSPAYVSREATMVDTELTGFSSSARNQMEPYAFDESDTYGDQGNPFSDNEPALIPSLSYIPPRDPNRPYVPAPLHSARGGRAILPSQQARFSFQSESNAGQFQVQRDPRADVPNAQPGPGLGIRHKSNGSYKAQDLPVEALIYSQSAGSLARNDTVASRYSHDYADQTNKGGQQRAEGIPEDVRRRYDGSAYDGQDW